LIQASYSLLPDTYSEKLETKLSQNLKINIEVINAGVNGYGPDQISLRLADELDWLKPDIVIISIFTDNDFGDLLRNNIYRLDKANQLVLNKYVLSQDVRNRYSQKKENMKF